MKKIISIIIVTVMIISAIPVYCFAGSSVTANGIVEISKYGNVKINLPHADVYKYFELGDIVTVSFGDVSIDVPLCVAFSDVDSGNAGLFCQGAGEDEETELAINTGNFAETYGIAKKTVFPDKTYKWDYQNGFSQSTVFTVKLKEKAGYLEEFTVRNLTSTNNRADYRELTDAQFANFRAVTAGHITDGVLYRTSSPVDTAIGRNTYADSICRENGITHFVNLGDSEESLKAYEGYTESYYCTVSHIAVEASMNPAADENKAKFAECFRYITANPGGKFAVHCREGKERTGMFIAIAECLMGASYEEITADYMTSYKNYYGIDENDKAYTVILNGNIKKTLTDLFGVDPQNADLVKEAEEYLSDIGLSYKEIISLETVLSGKCTLCVLIYNAFIHILRHLSAMIDSVSRL
ncbi:MAG: tyrosine-protein phosphatase [Clostridia bacterium]|nr:tyrosine-protein phosphatase [Clostridia bacterium]